MDDLQGYGTLSWPSLACARDNVERILAFIHRAAEVAEKNPHHDGTIASTAHRLEAETAGVLKAIGPWVPVIDQLYAEGSDEDPGSAGVLRIVPPPGESRAS